MKKKVERMKEIGQIWEFKNVGWHLINGKFKIKKILHSGPYYKCECVQGGPWNGSFSKRSVVGVKYYFEERLFSHDGAILIPFVSPKIGQIWDFGGKIWEVVELNPNCPKLRQIIDGTKTGIIQPRELKTFHRGRLLRAAPNWQKPIIKPGQTWEMTHEDNMFEEGQVRRHSILGVKMLNGNIETQLVGGSLLTKHYLSPSCFRQGRVVSFDYRRDIGHKAEIYERLKLSKGQIWEFDREGEENTTWEILNPKCEHDMVRVVESKTENTALLFRDYFNTENARLVGHFHDAERVDDQWVTFQLSRPELKKEPTLRIGQVEPKIRHYYVASLIQEVRRRLAGIAEGRDIYTDDEIECMLNSAMGIFNGIPKSTAWVLSDDEFFKNKEAKEVITAIAVLMGIISFDDYKKRKVLYTDASKLLGNTFWGSIMQNELDKIEKIKEIMAGKVPEIYNCWKTSSLKLPKKRIYEMDNKGNTKVDLMGTLKYELINSPIVDQMPPDVYLKQVLATGLFAYNTALPLTNITVEEAEKNVHISDLIIKASLISLESAEQIKTKTIDIGATIKTMKDFLVSTSKFKNKINSGGHLRGGGEINADLHLVPGQVWELREHSGFMFPFDLNAGKIMRLHTALNAYKIIKIDGPRVFARMIKNREGPLGYKILREEYFKNARILYNDPAEVFCEEDFDLLPPTHPFYNRDRIGNTMGEKLDEEISSKATCLDVEIRSGDGVDRSQLGIDRQADILQDCIIKNERDSGKAFNIDRVEITNIAAELSHDTYI